MFQEFSTKIDGDLYTYQVYSNGLLDGERPVILFLHGAGERGKDGFLQTKNGLGKVVRKGLLKYPSHVVFPQCPKGYWWSDKICERIAITALNEVEKNYLVDENRIYLTGISMGGYGGWYLSTKYKNKFAALVTMAGRLQPGEGRKTPENSILYNLSDDEAVELIAKHVSSMPIWITHGSLDKIVPVNESRRIYKALKDNGGDATFNEIQGSHHNVWDAEYLNDEMLDWLFSQNKSDK